MVGGTSCQMSELSLFFLIFIVTFFTSYHKRLKPVLNSFIAIKPAQEAKAAENSQQVGYQAARQIKEQLAAESALSGMEALVEEIKEADMVVHEESSSLQQLQKTHQSTNKATQQSQAKLKLLLTTWQLTQGNAANSQQFLEGVNTQLNVKEQLLEAAKIKLEQLGKQEMSSRTNLAKTKDAAKKTETAAAEAKQNVSRNRRKVKRNDSMT